MLTEKFHVTVLRWIAIALMVLGGAVLGASTAAAATPAGSDDGPRSAPRSLAPEEP